MNWWFFFIAVDLQYVNFNQSSDSIFITLSSIVVIQKRSRKEQKKFVKKFYLFGFGLPILQTVIPLVPSTNLYGPNGMWYDIRFQYLLICIISRCWLRSDHHGLYEFVFFYGEMGFTSVVALILWVQVIIRAFRSNKIIHTESYLIRHICMVVVYVVVFLVMFCHRLYMAITDSDSFVLILLHAICLSTIGKTNNFLNLFCGNN